MDLQSEKITVSVKEGTATGAQPSPVSAPACNPYTMPPWKESFTEEEKKQWRLELRRKFLNFAKEAASSHCLPLVLILATVFCPPLMFVWVSFVLLWSLGEVLYRRLKDTQRAVIRKLVPEKVAENPAFIELIDGVKQVRPFILFTAYIACAPISLVWMYAHWLLKLNKTSAKKDTGLSGAQSVASSLSFVQNQVNREEEEEENFFHSPAFAITCALLFVSGVPAVLTYMIYQYLGIDALLGFPSLDPRFAKVFLITGLYFGSVAWCGSVLFFRSWFTFPLNFSGEEEEIELDEKGIHRHVKSWFSQAVTMNMPWAGALALKWSEVQEIRLDQSSQPLYPLPQTAFKPDSLVYHILNRLALIVDGLQKGVHRSQAIYFSTRDGAAKNSMESFIRMNLDELSGDERAQLYYAIKKWAPNVVMDEGVQEKLTGSTALKAPAYTQLWFELLADKMPSRAASILPAETKLQNGTVTVKQRLSSGGQANVYLAETENGNECVLKEFILSTSDAVGALLESATEFELEATMLSELKHPRILEMHSFFTEARRLYIVLEKIDGVSLRQLIKSSKQPLSEKETIDIALQVCEVLQYLHEQEPPVVHRDISPDNLMMSKDDGIKVIDFSLAASKKSRRTTNTMGKHSYAPPEQLRDQPCPQSDIYGLGATMFYLLTGEDPKPITPADVKSKRSDVSDRLCQIIKQATAFEVDDRYSSAKWLVLDLKEALSELQPESADAPPAPEDGIFVSI